MTSPTDPREPKVLTEGELLGILDTLGVPRAVHRALVAPLPHDRPERRVTAMYSLIQATAAFQLRRHHQLHDRDIDFDTLREFASGAVQQVSNHRVAAQVSVASHLLVLAGDLVALGAAEQMRTDIEAGVHADRPSPITVLLPALEACKAMVIDYERALYDECDPNVPTEVADLLVEALAAFDKL